MSAASSIDLADVKQRLDSDIWPPLDVVRAMVAELEQLRRDKERLTAQIESDRKDWDENDERMNRYFDRITKSRGDAIRRAEAAEADARRVQQTADAYRASAIEHAEEVAERDAELAVERKRSAALARVVEELGGELVASEANHG